MCICHIASYLYAKHCQADLQQFCQRHGILVADTLLPLNTYHGMLLSWWHQLMHLRYMHDGNLLVVSCAGKVHYHEQPVSD